MLPYLALALYIVSLIVSLILMLTVRRSKTIPTHTSKWFKVSVFIHFQFLLLFFADLLLLGIQHEDFHLLKLSFLFYFCTGTALCGWAFRTSIPLYGKIYFALFDLSLLLFLFMPFNFSVFLLSGNFKKSDEIKFPISEHYYIMEQGNVMSKSGPPIYRVVKHHGMFNQTVQYNLNFGGKLDSIHVMSIINDKSASIRAYIKSPDKKSAIDSSDAEIKLKHESKDEIQRQI